MRSAKEEADARGMVEIAGKSELEVKGKQKSEHPDSRKAELRLMKIEPVHRQLNKTNRKLYALQKQKETVQLALNDTPKSIFRRRERKELQERIDGLDRQITFCRNQLLLIPDANGYRSVRMQTDIGASRRLNRNTGWRRKRWSRCTGHRQSGMG